MKTLKILLLLPFIAFLGCNDDSTGVKEVVYENVDLTLNLSADQDLNGGQISCSDSDILGRSEISVARSGRIKGSIYPFGEAISSESPYYIDACSFNELTNQLTLHFSGYLTNIYSERLNYNGTFVINSSNGTFGGEIQYTGGSGRFYNCDGYASVTSGNVDFTTGTISWRGNGKITILLTSEGS